MKNIFRFILYLPILILASPFILKWELETRMITRYLKTKAKTFLTQEELKEFETLAKDFSFITFLVRKASDLENTEKKVDLEFWKKLLRISELTKARDNIIDCAFHIEKRKGNKEVNLIKNPPSSEF